MGGIKVKFSLNVFNVGVDNIVVNIEINRELFKDKISLSLLPTLFLSLLLYISGRNRLPLS